MSDLNLSLLALTGDILDLNDPELDALDRAQIYFERQVSREDVLSDRQICLALLWLAGTRVQLHNLRGATHTLEHLRVRSHNRFPDLETLADFLEVRALLAAQQTRKASGMLDRLKVESDDPRTRARLKALHHYLRGEFYSAAGQPRVADDEYTRALEALRVGPAQHEDLSITAEIYNAQGLAFFREDRAEEALEAYARAGTVADHINFVLAHARSLRGRGTVYSACRDLENARTYLEQALKIYRQIRSPYGILRTSISLGRAHYVARDYEQAMVHFQNAQVQCGEGRFPEEAAEVSSCIGDILVAQGRYEEAADLYEEDLRVVIDSQNDRARAHALRNVGRVQRLLGNFSRAEAFLDEARALFARLNDPIGLCHVLQQLVMCHVEQGRPTQAREALESMRSWVERLGRPLEHGVAHMLEGVVLHREGRSERAREHLEKSLQVLSREPGYYTVLCTIELANLLYEEDEPESSLFHLRRAVEAARDQRFYDLEKRALDLLKEVDRAEWVRLRHQSGSSPAPPLKARRVDRAFVCVLLMEVLGESVYLDSDLEAHAQRLEAYFNVLSQVVSDYGGLISRFMGTRVMAVFGLSGTCKPADAYRCALACVEAVARGRQPGGGSTSGLAAALATGETMEGTFGPPERKEPSLMGGPVDLAALLLTQAAAGEVLACPDTFRAISQHVHHPSQRDVVIPGTNQKIPAYQVAAPWTVRLKAREAKLEA